MPNEQELQKTETEIFDEVIARYRKASEDSLSAIMKCDISVSMPEKRSMKLHEVEYSLLEPALFAKYCLTSNAAGTMMMIFRQRDVQIFLNKLMGIDELASPDFVFDEISLSAAKEIMNQMSQGAVKAGAKYLEHTMEASGCELTESDEAGNLTQAMGEDPDTEVLVFTYQMKIDHMIDSEFMWIFSRMAQDTLTQESEAKKARDDKAAEEEQQVKIQASMNQEGGARQKALFMNGGMSSKDQNMADIEIPYRSNIGLIMNVPLKVNVEIGRAKRKLKEVLGFDKGTVIELEKQADAPVDIIVNGQLIARGNVVVIDDNFGVRITEIINKNNIFGNGE